MVHTVSTSAASTAAKGTGGCAVATRPPLTGFCQHASTSPVVTEERPARARRWQRSDTSRPTRADGHADPRLVGLQAEWVERVARPDLLRCLFWIPHHPGVDVENTGELLARIVGGPTRVAARRERPPGCAHFVRHCLGRRCRAIRVPSGKPRVPNTHRYLCGVGRSRSAMHRNRIRRDKWFRRPRRAPARCAGSASGTRNRSTPFRIARCGRPADPQRDGPARHRVSAAEVSAVSACSAVTVSGPPYGPPYS